MPHPADAINREIEAHSPPLHAALSALGRDAVFPPDIPFQANEAKGKRYNGTIGIFTDGRGGAVPLPSMDAALNLGDDDRDRAFLYSPASGLPEARERWRGWQRRSIAEVGRREEDVPSSLPVVTCGLSHGLSLCADLFTEPGRPLVLTTPFWGNYRQGFVLRRGAELCPTPAYRESEEGQLCFDPTAIATKLDALSDGQPALALLNFPSNPGGYSPTVPERKELRDSLVAAAQRRPLLVLCDDSYAGLVYADDVPAASMFWELAGVHESLVPIKIDGATKEFSFFGGRVGFLTFGLAPDSPAAEALESKLKCLIRATVGSPSSTAQTILLQILRRGDAEIDAEIGTVRRIARQRYDALRPALDAVDRSLLRPLPFNSGLFALLELPEELGLGAEEVRQHLLTHHDTGIVSIAPRYLRLATCSVDAADLPEMLARVERGVSELVAQRQGG